MQHVEQNSPQWQKLLLLIKPHLQQTEFVKRKQQYHTLFISRLLAENLFAFLLQYIGLILTPPSTYPIPLWFASGTAFAFVFIRGYTLIPGLWFGSFVAYYLAKFGPYTSFYCATLLTFQPFILSKLCYRYISACLIFYFPNKFILFIIACMSITSVISYLLFSITFVESTHPLIWLQWWLADINGTLIFAFALVTLDSYFPDFHLLNKINKFRLIFLFGSLLLLIFLLVFSHSTILTILFFAFNMGFIIIISRYFGWCGSISAFFMFGSMYGLAAILQTPLFLAATKGLLLILQGLMLINIIHCLLLCIKKYHTLHKHDDTSFFRKLPCKIL